MLDQDRLAAASYGKDAHNRAAVAGFVPRPPQPGEQVYDPRSGSVFIMPTPEVAARQEVARLSGLLSSHASHLEDLQAMKARTPGLIADARTRATEAQAKLDAVPAGAEHAQWRRHARVAVADALYAIEALEAQAISLKSNITDANRLVAELRAELSAAEKGASIAVSSPAAHAASLRQQRAARAERAKS